MKIPDDVYLTRCRYCHHGRSGAENVEIPKDKLFSYFWTKDAPCNIIGISKCDRVPGGGCYQNDYWGEHVLFTCDRYQVDTYWKDIIMREVLNGRSPANFAPDTWEPLAKLEGRAAAQQWAKLQAEERAKEAAKAKTLEKQKVISKPDGIGQLSLFEMEG